MFFLYTKWMIWCCFNNLDEQSIFFCFILLLRGNRHLIWNSVYIQHTPEPIIILVQTVRCSIPGTCGFVRFNYRGKHCKRWQFFILLFRNELTYDKGRKIRVRVRQRTRHAIHQRVPRGTDWYVCLAGRT